MTSGCEAISPQDRHPVVYCCCKRLSAQLGSASPWPVAGKHCHSGHDRLSCAQQLWALQTHEQHVAQTPHLEQIFLAQTSLFTAGLVALLSCQMQTPHELMRQSTDIKSKMSMRIGRHASSVNINCRIHGTMLQGCAPSQQHCKIGSGYTLLWMLRQMTLLHSISPQQIVDPASDGLSRRLA